MSKNPIDFASLSTAAKHLNQQSDSFHNLLENIQSTIVSLGIGLEIWLTGVENFVPNPLDFPYGSDKHGWTIGLTKCDRSWCIAIREAYLSNDERMDLCVHDEDNITPLLESSRERRIASLKLIPALVARLTDEAKRAAKAMDEAIEQARALDHSLISKADKPATILADDDIPF